MSHPTATPVELASPVADLTGPASFPHRSARPARSTPGPAPAVGAAHVARVLDRAHASARNLYVTTRCLQVITGTSTTDGNEPVDGLAAAYEALVAAQAGLRHRQDQLAAATGQPT